MSGRQGPAFVGRRRAMGKMLGASLVAGLPALSRANAAQIAPRVADGLPDGRICVLSYSTAPLPLAAVGGASGAIAVLGVNGEAPVYIPSDSPNLHDLVVPASNPEGNILAIGHEARELIEFFSNDFTRRESRRYAGVTFRGHGLAYGAGALIAAESSTSPIEGGWLLYLDATGKEITRVATGGIRPHDVVDCGDWIAVAHYGNRPQGANAGSASSACNLLFDVAAPSVAFLNKRTLAVESNWALPTDGVATHLCPDGEGAVLVMQMQAQRLSCFLGDEVMPEQAQARNSAALLPVELESGLFELPLPVHRVDRLKGVVSKFDTSATTQRRGQSFARSDSLGLSVATFAASQTLWMKWDGWDRPEILSALRFGVPDPRGCAFLGGGALLAVSGNDNNVAIIEPKSARLLTIVPAVLGRHSHIRHLAT
ncbi:hypothetical protein LMG2828_05905 [Achromobacter piechaudii]|uniref:DUF1513 domain-containing protein n=1 Tax=Achromobacter piechaudii TaxID=72556 RepID=UPI0014662C48|nr:DUF1513 domain-containing protein [Achromobacter piechaudii]CAB3924731.1 hypothetical protein LMG2828_05905 [Achromobacter piechaudii]